LYAEPGALSNAIGYAKFFSRSHDAVIHVYDAAGNVIETHKHAGEISKSDSARETKSRHTVKRDG
jgi:tryptophan synthase beta subunit